MADIEDFNGKIIEEFRANGGPHPRKRRSTSGTSTASAYLT
jgi:hypothetical protein